MTKWALSWVFKTKSSADKAAVVIHRLVTETNSMTRLEKADRISVMLEELYPETPIPGTIPTRSLF